MLSWPETAIVGFYYQGEYLCRDCTLVRVGDDIQVAAIEWGHPAAPPDWEPVTFYEATEKAIDEGYECVEVSHASKRNDDGLCHVCMTAICGDCGRRLDVEPQKTP